MYRDGLFSWNRVRLIILCSCLMTPAYWSAVANPLHNEAIKSPDAEHSLLTDVSRANSRLIAVGEQGHIVYSDDDGKNWEHAEVPVSFMLTSVSFPDANRGWAVGHEGIVLASQDSGQSWQLQLNGRDVASLQVAALEVVVSELEQELQELSESEDRQSKLDALDDAQYFLEEAQAQIEEGINTPLLGVTFINTSVGFAYGAYGVLLGTNNGGESWELLSLRLENPENYHLYDLEKTAGGALLLCGEAGTMYRSDNDGQSWERIPFDYTGSLFGLVTSGDVAVTFGLRGKIFRSIDQGQSWQSVETENISTLLGGNSVSDSKMILVGASGTVLESKDEGVSFVPTPSGTREVISGVTRSSTGALILTGFGGVKILNQTGNPDQGTP